MWIQQEVLTDMRILTTYTLLLRFNHLRTNINLHYKFRDDSFCILWRTQFSYISYKNRRILYEEQIAFYCENSTSTKYKIHCIKKLPSF